MWEERFAFVAFAVEGVGHSNSQSTLFVMSGLGQGGRILYNDCWQVREGFDPTLFSPLPLKESFQTSLSRSAYFVHFPLARSPPLPLPFSRLSFSLSFSFPSARSLLHSGINEFGRYAL